VTPIASAEYPTPARRPANSVMSSDKLIQRFCAIPEWEQALALCLG
jgi:dTDP-4-dehydrorhamnose reductase